MKSFLITAFKAKDMGRRSKKFISWIVKADNFKNAEFYAQIQKPAFVIVQITLIS